MSLMDTKKQVETFEKSLTICRRCVKASLMFKELCEKLDPYKKNVKKVRCLAIGSFYEDLPARYQLALLMELFEYIHVEDTTLSIYDPVFNKHDIEFIKQNSWTIEETGSQNDDSPDETLFFLPHAPLDLTERILSTEKPKYWLANHTLAHIDRYTKVQLNLKYPLMSKLAHSLEEEERKLSIANDNDFTKFVPKRKRRNNKNKCRYEEPKIDYDSIHAYFKRLIVITDFQRGLLLKGQPWNNAFSDLAFQLIE